MVNGEVIGRSLMPVVVVAIVVISQQVVFGHVRVVVVAVVVLVVIKVISTLSVIFTCQRNIHLIIIFVYWKLTDATHP